MTMERLLWFDEQARSGRHPGSGAIAARFGVSLRTAQRDIEFLRDGLQAPLKYVPSEKGYAYSDPGFYLPSSFFRKEELIALLIARKLFGEVRPPRKEELEGIYGRLSEIFSVPLLEKIRESVTFDITRGMELPGKLFFDLLRAVTQRRRVLIRQASGSGGGPAESEIEPLRLHFSQGGWHLIGMRAGKAGIGVYPLQGIRSVEVTAESFVPGKSAIRVDAFLRRGGGLFRGGTVRGVRIRFHPRRSARASELELHPGQRLQFELDGSVVLEIPSIPFLEVLGIALRHGRDAAVVAPKELGDAVRAEADRLEELYRGPGGRRTATNRDDGRR